MRYNKKRSELENVLLEDTNSIWKVIWVKKCEHYLCMCMGGARESGVIYVALLV